MRSTLAALSLLLVRCGDVVAPSADSQADSSTPSAPPLDVAIDHRGTLHALTAIESGDRVIAASLWSEGHENIGLYTFDRDGGRATRVGSFFYRAGIIGAQGPIVRAPSIAASGERVAAAFVRGARAGSEGPWIRATAIEVFALDGGAPMRTAEYEIGAPGLLDGDTRPEFSATITSTRDGWLVLDLLADLRLRVTRVDRDARVLSQRAFSQPLGADGFGIDRWVVRAQRERFWIIAPSEGGRALGDRRRRDRREREGARRSAALAGREPLLLARRIDGHRVQRRARGVGRARHRARSRAAADASVARGDDPARVRAARAVAARAGRGQWLRRRGRVDGTGVVRGRSRGATGDSRRAAGDRGRAARRVVSAARGGAERVRRRAVRQAFDQATRAVGAVVAGRPICRRTRSYNVMMVGGAAPSSG